ncbi:adenosine deaminase [Microbacterium sediminis]|uniref:adenosine deaminase n=1 Tax=Microbacterium sediminis TaxID=904291 RepID=UPI00107169EF|nr:adenosine deaminase [Microbacterium sediminis]QBR73634.1 adenosine deaminase [Microbacterium sediminis]
MSDAIRALPKVSLHDHLDGGLRPQTLLELGARVGLELPASDPASLGDWFLAACTSGSLPEYLTTFDLTLAVMQTRDGLERVAREFVEDLAADGVVYGEVRWAPELHQGAGLTLEEAVAAVADGFAQGERAVALAGGRIRVRQLITAMRQNDRSAEIARLAIASRDAGVVGFDLAGPEDGFLPSRHAEAFAILAEALFPVTVHAGEAAGVDSIRSALVDGRALRLGHGVRIADDLEVPGGRAGAARRGATDAADVRLGELAAWVRDRRIPLELSPSSNVQTAGFADWGAEIADHPIDLLRRLGFAVTVNTDNRLMSRTSLTRELTLLADAFGYGLGDLERLQVTAAEAAFLPLAEREELVARVRDGFRS